MGRPICLGSSLLRRRRSLTFGVSGWGVRVCGLQFLEAFRGQADRRPRDFQIGEEESKKSIDIKKRFTAHRATTCFHPPTPSRCTTTHCAVLCHQCAVLSHASSKRTLRSTHRTLCPTRKTTKTLPLCLCKSKRQNED